MKTDKNLLLVIGVIVVLLLLAGVGYMAGVFGGTSATPTPVPSASVTATPTAQPTSAPTVLPTTAPTVLPTATPTATPTVAPSPGAGSGVRETGYGYTITYPEFASYEIHPNPNYVPPVMATPTPTPTPTPTATPVPTGDIVASFTFNGVATDNITATYTVVDSSHATVGMTGLPYGDYQVTASIPGFDSQTKTVTVNAASVPVSFAFATPTGDIVATSTLDSITTDKPVIYTVSNGTGTNWGLTGLAYGSYTVTATLTGYASPSSQTVTVNAASVPVTFAFVSPTPVNAMYNSAGTYTFMVPSGVISLDVTVIGGGGGGGGGNWGSGFTYLGGAGGGGGSGYVTTQTISVTPGQSISVIVGEGGGSGTAFYPVTLVRSVVVGTTWAGDGGNGGASSFGVYSANGGIGGKGGHDGVDVGDDGKGGAGGAGYNSGTKGQDGSNVAVSYGGIGGSGYLGYGAGGNGGSSSPTAGASGASGAVLVTNTVIPS